MSRRIKPTVESIPTCLRETAQWICWKYATRDGKETKVPTNPITGKAVDATMSAYWVPFESALKAFNRNKSLSGVAFVLSPDDPYTGVDLDDCLDEHGQFIWGEDIVRQLDSQSDRPLHLADFCEHIGTPDLSDAAYHIRRAEAAGFVKKIGTREEEFSLQRTRVCR